MRHRLVSGTGLGTSEKVRLDNEGTFPSIIVAEAAIKTFFEYWDGFDYQIDPDFVAMGYEPAYQYEKLKIVKIARNKDDSTFEYGKSFGHYGSQVVSKKKRYSDYKRKSEFTRFVDKWHPVLFGEVK